MARKTGFDLKTVTMAEILLLMIFGMVIVGSSELEDLRSRCVVPPEEVQLGGFDLGDPNFWNRCINYDLLDEENKLLLAEIAQRDNRIATLLAQQEELFRQVAAVKEALAQANIDSEEGETIADERDALLIQIALLEAENKNLYQSLQGALAQANIDSEEGETIADERDALLIQIALLEAENKNLYQSLQEATDEMARLQGITEGLKEALGDEAGHGGRDLPSCWTTSTNDLEFVLKIDVGDDGLIVEPSWPDQRQQAVVELGYDRIDFEQVRTLREWSGVFEKAMNYAVPKDCRFFVEVHDGTQDKNNWFPYWNMLGQHFYMLVRQ
jgi:hypothetical protein